MMWITTFLLVAVTSPVLVNSNEGTDGKQEALDPKASYDDIPFPIQRAIDVVTQKNTLLKDSKILAMRQCWARVDLERNLVSLVVARNINKPIKVLGENGEAMMVTIPRGWFIPRFLIKLQYLRCIMHAKKMMDTWTKRTVMPHY